MVRICPVDTLCLDKLFIYTHGIGCGKYSMPVDLSVSTHEVVIVVLMFEIIDALPLNHLLHHFCFHSFGSLSEPHSPVHSVKRHEVSLAVMFVLRKSIADASAAS